MEKSLKTSLLHKTISFGLYIVKEEIVAGRKRFEICETFSKRSHELTEVFPRLFHIKQ